MLEVLLLLEISQNAFICRKERVQLKVAAQGKETSSGILMHHFTLYLTCYLNFLLTQKNKVMIREIDHKKRKSEAFMGYTL